MPVAILTDQGLLDRLSASARRPISHEAQRRQRVSFVYSNMPSEAGMTKQQVADALDRKAD